MRRRADFLAANRGRRAPMPGFVLLVRERADGDPAMRIGITVTKKIGGAVIRNRMKRRFRVLARELLPVHGVAGADHVLIGRSEGIERDFALLRAELEKALGKVMSRSVGDAPRKAKKRPARAKDQKHSPDAAMPGNGSSGFPASQKQGESSS
ncbi:ribonuclease P protein component [Sphingobium agri]|uniref:Ribonuclease P protein component n=1 Tax=Sphingobium agri TaxID=2933566 RepID=A0ABT0DU26_9SPHN|nr:ribonuclease P protein component [Sphingobium agri]MCK0530619.1 ribonuclease P protein component [Sphingobium agri]